MTEKPFLTKLKKSIKRALPEGVNLSDALTDTLSLSKESVYRRLRGETPFNLDELMHLRSVYNISLDSLSSSSRGILVDFRPIFNSHENFIDYFKNIIERFKRINGHPHAITYNAAENLPFFRQLGYANLAAFKVFFWRRSILNHAEFQNKTFAVQEETTELDELCSEIYRLYCVGDSVEIWTRQTLDGTLNQIVYYADCGLIDHSRSLIAVYKDLMQLITDLRDHARQSCKIFPNGKNGGNFTLYHCELSLDNNSVLLYTDRPSYVAMGFNSFNSLQSNDEKLLNESWKWFEAMIQKSIMVSGISERSRYEFYRENVDKIMKSATARLGDDIQKIIPEV